MADCLVFEPSPVNHIMRHINGDGKETRDEIVDFEQPLQEVRRSGHQRNSTKTAEQEDTELEIGGFDENTSSSEQPLVKTEQHKSEVAGEVELCSPVVQQQFAEAEQAEPELEQFHTAPEQLECEGENQATVTEIMEGQTAIQTLNPIPTMEDLNITGHGDTEGQTTVPRVNDLSSKGEATLAAQESLEDFSSGGSEGVNGSDTGTDGAKADNTEVLAAQSSTTTTKESSKMSGGKSKRKEDKAIEHILKALNSLDTTEEKLAALCKKYADLHEEHRVQQSSYKQTQKKLQVTTREKDQLQSEHNKAVMAKGKLESLCRELQKHNKLVKEESLARAREEEERRKEVSGKFQTTISEIQAQMQDNHERNIKLKEENVDLGHKLKSLVEQYEAREEHIDKLMKHRELENQLHEAKMQQAQCLLATEQEKSRKEREMVLLTMSETKKKSELHEAQEKQLRTQLAMYTEKYDEFQSTLNKSNEVFGKFKSEMDKMGKRIKKLEKETAMWRGKWEASNKALLEMAEEKQVYDKEKAVFKAKIEKLESLCRALQAERRGKSDGLPEVKLDPSVGETQKNFDPTKTPPNTPDAPSRTSPETVQGAADGEGNGQAESGEQTGGSSAPDHHGSSQVIDTPQLPVLPPVIDNPQEVLLPSQSDHSGAAQLSQSDEVISQSNDTAAGPSNQSDSPVSEQIAEQPN